MIFYMTFQFEYKFYVVDFQKIYKISVLVGYFIYDFLV